MKNDTSFIRVPRLPVFAAAFFLSACATPPPPPAEPAPAPVLAPEPEVEVVEEIQAPVQLKPRVPLRYTVKKGDTLWSIASYFLRDPWQWPELWFVNPRLKNPHRLYPGDVLELFFKDGRPVLAREGEAEAIQADVPPLNVEKLSPQVRSEALAQAVPAIPIDAIRNYLRGPRLVTEAEMATAPYLLEFVDEHLFGSAGESIYVRGLREDGGVYSVLRLGDAYRDPDDDSLIGYEALPIADAEVTRPGEPATLKLVKSYREARKGDRLLRAESEAFEAQFYPHIPEQPVRGRIVSVYNGLSQIGQYQIVAINRGESAGLKPGHVLHIFQAGRLVDDPYRWSDVVLPDLKAGVLMVFKVTPRLSYGLVMSATRAIHVLDAVEKPQ